MTLDILRSLGTVLAFVAFIAVCVWAYSSKRRADFDQAANLPFADEADDGSPDLSSSKDKPAPKENAA